MQFVVDIRNGILQQRTGRITSTECTISGMDTDCFLSGFAYSGRVPFSIEVYSPGVCPAGYATATESFDGDTTLAVCCQRYGGYGWPSQ